MKRLLVAAAVVVLSIYVLWTFETRRSITVPLEGAGYDAAYTVAWGWEMNEKIAFSRGALAPSAPSSDWLWIYDKSYNSGMSLYRTRDGQTYYLTTQFEMIVFEPSTGSLKQACYSGDDPPHTALGEKLRGVRPPQRDEVDPGGRDREGFISSGEQGSMIVMPSASRYYEGLVYLGRFGVLKNLRDGRGEGVAFAPTDKSPERRPSFADGCG